ncbi:transmembrane protease serine 11D-like [Linepithema humile]|uniref:transmembrane protease serine 11D-like n=1 Tax=Linepithema humile TaxID=83485 RepID=UPI00351E8B27
MQYSITLYYYYFSKINFYNLYMYIISINLIIFYFFITECGVSGGISNRIVGGKITIPHIFPWVIALFNKGNLHCGGTLINSQYVLTAGHCVKWYSIYLYSMNVYKLKIFICIFFYVPISISDRCKKYTNKFSMIGTDYTEHNVKVTGWGRVTTSGGASKFLRQATLKVMSWAACRNTSFGDHLTESMLCAYRDDIDACQGDSGGPLLYERTDGKYEVIGIVSWGIGCANRGIPGVYVKNTDYLNWIKYHTKDGIYCAGR